MPYCPECLMEYIEGTAVCSDCRVGLLPGPPPVLVQKRKDGRSQQITCPVCKAEIELEEQERIEGRVSCPSCQKTLIWRKDPERAQKEVATGRPKNVALAVILALLFGPLGMLYVGRFWQSLLIALAVAILRSAFIYGPGGGSLAVKDLDLVIGGTLWIGLAVWASELAKEINENTRSDEDDVESVLLVKAESVMQAKFLAAALDNAGIPYVARGLGITDSLGGSAGGDVAFGVYSSPRGPEVYVNPSDLKAAIEVLDSIRGSELSDDQDIDSDSGSSSSDPTKA